LFKIATQRVSLWHFHIYMYLAQFGSSPLFSFCLSPFLMMGSTSLKILHSFLYREYINHIYLLNFPKKSFRLNKTIMAFFLRFYIYFISFWWQVLYLFYFFLVTLEFEIRALCLLGRCSTIWSQVLYLDRLFYPSFPVTMVIYTSIG
jgi:hypothetical protein